MDLSLRKTVIGGETLEDDYVVWRDGREIGRLRRSFHHVEKVPEWVWHITVPLPMAAWTHGSADSFEAAKGAFREAWERFYAGLSPDQIDHWHRTQDARKP